MTNKIPIFSPLTHFHKIANGTTITSPPPPFEPWIVHGHGDGQHTRMNFTSGFSQQDVLVLKVRCYEWILGTE